MTAVYAYFAGNDLAAVALFLVLFLVIGGAALILTPKIARWVDGQKKKHPGFYDGMLEQDPGAKENEEQKEDGDGAD